MDNSSSKPLHQRSIRMQSAEQEKQPQEEPPLTKRKSTLAGPAAESGVGAAAAGGGTGTSPTFRLPSYGAASISPIDFDSGASPTIFHGSGSFASGAARAEKQQQQQQHQSSLLPPSSSQLRPQQPPSKTVPHNAVTTLPFHTTLWKQLLNAAKLRGSQMSYWPDAPSSLHVLKRAFCIRISYLVINYSAFGDSLSCQLVMSRWLYHLGHSRKLQSIKRTEAQLRGKHQTPNAAGTPTFFLYGQQQPPTLDSDCAVNVSPISNVESNANRWACSRRLRNAQRALYDSAKLREYVATYIWPMFFAQQQQQGMGNSILSPLESTRMLRMSKQSFKQLHRRISLIFFASECAAPRVELEFLTFQRIGNNIIQLKQQLSESMPYNSQSRLPPSVSPFEEVDGTAYLIHPLFVAKEIDVAAAKRPRSGAGGLGAMAAPTSTSPPTSPLQSPNATFRSSTMGGTVGGKETQGEANTIHFEGIFYFVLSVCEFFTASNSSSTSGVGVATPTENEYLQLLADLTLLLQKQAIGQRGHKSLCSTTATLGNTVSAERTLRGASSQSAFEPAAESSQNTTKKSVVAAMDDFDDLASFAPPGGGGGSAAIGSVIQRSDSRQLQEEDFFGGGPGGSGEYNEDDVDGEGRRRAGSRASQSKGSGEGDDESEQPQESARQRAQKRADEIRAEKQRIEEEAKNKFNKPRRKKGEVVSVFVDSLHVPKELCSWEKGEGRRADPKEMDQNSHTPSSTGNAAGAARQSQQLGAGMVPKPPAQQGNNPINNVAQGVNSRKSISLAGGDQKRKTVSMAPTVLAAEAVRKMSMAAGLASPLKPGTQPAPVTATEVRIEELLKDAQSLLSSIAPSMREIEAKEMELASASTFFDRAQPGGGGQGENKTPSSAPSKDDSRSVSPAQQPPPSKEEAASNKGSRRPSISVLSSGGASRRGSAVARSASATPELPFAPTPELTFSSTSKDGAGEVSGRSDATLEQSFFSKVVEPMEELVSAAKKWCAVPEAEKRASSRRQSTRFNSIRAAQRRSTIEGLGSGTGGGGQQNPNSRRKKSAVINREQRRASTGSLNQRDLSPTAYIDVQCCVAPAAATSSASSKMRSSKAKALGAEESEEGIGEETAPRALSVLQLQEEGERALKTAFGGAKEGCKVVSMSPLKGGATVEATALSSAEHGHILCAESESCVSPNRSYLWAQSSSKIRNRGGKQKAVGAQRCSTPSSNTPATRPNQKV